MAQDKRVDRIAANAAPVQPNAKENNGAPNHTAANAAPAPTTWLKPLADYDRHERREYQVTRFG
jgi:hypothetical protein